MKVAIVHDVYTAVEGLRRILSLDTSLDICWIVSSGKQALERCAVNPPDLILMDISSPVIDALEAIRQIMLETPCPILIVTTSVSKNAAIIFEAMGAGAADVVAVPILENEEQGTEELLKKINTLRRLVGNSSSSSRQDNNHLEGDSPTESAMKLIAIGCSTGGPLAALKILSTFPANFPAAFVLVQHMDERFTGGLAEWLDQQIQLKARIVKESDRLENGVVLVPSAKAHIVLKSNGRIGYLDGSFSGGYYLPSVDIFFKSIAERWNGKSVGVLLTGMGRDGAEGLLAMRKQGMHTITQNKETCVVFGMPKAAIELSAAQSVLPLGQIGAKINSIMRRN